MKSKKSCRNSIWLPNAQLNIDTKLWMLTGEGATGKLELSGRQVLDVLNDMAEIFLPKDRLLTSAGVFPVWYWFVRSTGQANFHRIREFLVQFEKARKENRALMTANPRDAKLDRELVEYDGYNRSTNDQQATMVDTAY